MFRTTVTRCREGGGGELERGLSRFLGSLPKWVYELRFTKSFLTTLHKTEIPFLLWHGCRGSLFLRDRPRLFSTVKRGTRKTDSSVPQPPNARERKAAGSLPRSFTCHYDDRLYSKIHYFFPLPPP